MEIVRGYIPGSIGRVAELHGTYYHEHWDFGLIFEAKVASELSDFLVRYDRQQDGFWTASLAGCIEASIAIDAIHAHIEGAHLRWFITSDGLRGKGVGTQLIEVAVDHCRTAGYAQIFLWTFEGLDAARHLYEKAGFKLVEQRRGRQWGTELNEQRFVLQLKR